MKKLLLSGVLIVLGSAVGQLGGATTLNASNGAEPKFFNFSGWTEKPGNRVYIHSVIADAQDKSGVCPYYLKSLQYSEKSKTLTLNLDQEPCFNDAFGASRGDVIWAVPTSLLSKGAKLTVLISRGAGPVQTEILEFDDAAQAFNKK